MLRRQRARRPTLHAADERLRGAYGAPPSPAADAGVSQRWCAAAKMTPSIYRATDGCCGELTCGKQCQGSVRPVSGLINALDRGNKSTENAQDACLFQTDHIPF